MTYEERKEKRPGWGRMGAAVRWKDLPPFEVRFWDRVKMGDSSECWPWTGHITPKTGYGSLYTINQNSKRREYKLPHRVAWALVNGPIPEGLFVCHRCDNRRCCNPNHLFTGTAKDNMRDAFNKGRLPMIAINGQKQIGESHRCAKLNKEQVLKIREQYSSGLSERALAKTFGVDHATIRDVGIRRTWKHV